MEEIQKFFKEKYFQSKTGQDEEKIWEFFFKCKIRECWFMDSYWLKLEKKNCEGKNCKKLEETSIWLDKPIAKRFIYKRGFEN